LLLTNSNRFFPSLQNYEPNFSCNFERRVGGTGNGDGPKWVCDPHRIVTLAQQRKAKNPNAPGCVVYSIGSNGDFQFELAVQNVVGKGTCDIHIFDMGDYGGEMPSELDATYHKWGLKKQEDKDNGKATVVNGEIFRGLKDVIKELGHEKLETIDIFKIDCEGCEWRTYTDWMGPDIPNLQQILVETHQAPEKHALAFFDTLKDAGYATFHKEPNLLWTSNMEYAFLKLDKKFFE